MFSRYQEQIKYKPRLKPSKSYENPQNFNRFFGLGPIDHEVGCKYWIANSLFSQYYQIKDVEKIYSKQKFNLHAMFLSISQISAHSNYSEQWEERGKSQ